MNDLIRYTIGASDYYDAAAADAEFAIYRNETDRAFEITEALRQANAELALQASKPPANWTLMDFQIHWKRRAETAEAKLQQMAEAIAKWLA